VNILFAEDDSEFAERVRTGLIERGHNVTLVSSAASAAAAWAHEKFDAIILDRMLADGDVTLHLGSWRSCGMRFPVLMLTGMTEVCDRISGLDAGADDYVSKPVDAAELDARLRAIGRRSLPTLDDSALIQAGSLRIDRFKREVWRGDRRIFLQPRELRLLEELAMARGDPVTKRVLLKAIWNIDFDTRTKLIETHMSRLRDKLAGDGRQDVIETVKGAGYRLRIDA
jgi:two-component system OmpR family response regulator